jgi:hypothetical protein
MNFLEMGLAVFELLEYAFVHRPIAYENDVTG